MGYGVGNDTISRFRHDDIHSTKQIFIVRLRIRHDENVAVSRLALAGDNEEELPQLLELVPRETLESRASEAQEDNSRRFGRFVLRSVLLLSNNVRSRG